MTRASQTLRLRPADGHYQPHAMWAPSGDLHLTIALGQVPPRSPYQPGDWVRMHGYLAYPDGPRRWGFRGFVLGDRGNTLLYGLTDDGAQWTEHWGHLSPEGACGCRGPWCTCCPHPARFAHRPARTEQLSLFGGGTLRAAR